MDASRTRARETFTHTARFKDDKDKYAELTIVSTVEAKARVDLSLSSTADTTMLKLCGTVKRTRGADDDFFDDAYFDDDDGGWDDDDYGYYDDGDDDGDGDDNDAENSVGESYSDDGDDGDDDLTATGETSAFSWSSWFNTFTATPPPSPFPTSPPTLNSTACYNTGDSGCLGTHCDYWSSQSVSYTCNMRRRSRTPVPTN